MMISKGVLSEYYWTFKVSLCWTVTLEFLGFGGYRYRGHL